ncbi:hypothetical protein M378DRAFT_156566 [Amanita muscaria Koide BX008]|uniref:Uncharacterized protein n=1 Tax=Amanita muscaria (strain Koide BX008) TaxID=946122 RepID=A0A0C2T3I7_AMAMK|nr:hypothetical protein M378DRAFT_156566 [Amanita muscaria Koide BX008]
MRRDCWDSGSEGEYYLERLFNKYCSFIATREIDCATSLLEAFGLSSIRFRSIRQSSTSELRKNALIPTRIKFSERCFTRTKVAKDRQETGPKCLAAA